MSRDHELVIASLTGTEPDITVVRGIIQVESFPEN
jgi:hypothetical protein